MQPKPNMTDQELKEYRDWVAKWSKYYSEPIPLQADRLLSLLDEVIARRNFASQQISWQDLIFIKGRGLGKAYPEMEKPPELKVGQWIIHDGSIVQILEIYSTDQWKYRPVSRKDIFSFPDISPSVNFHIMEYDLRTGLAKLMRTESAVVYNVRIDDLLQYLNLYNSPSEKPPPLPSQPNPQASQG